MIDIETMGTSTEAAIVAIGAVLFDPETEQLGDTYYAKVDLADAVKDGGKIDAATVLWWLKQGDAARDELTGAGRVDIDIALAGLYVFIEDNTDKDALQVWANGASFDLPILTTAFPRSGYIHGPWKFYQERCYRTLKNIRPDIKAVAPAGNVKHNALDDAKAQALHAIALLRAIAPQPTQQREPAVTVSFNVEGFDKMREDLAALPPGTQLFAEVQP